MAYIKQKDWTQVPWTKFVEQPVSPSWQDKPIEKRPSQVFCNSRYVVQVFMENYKNAGHNRDAQVAHLSIKTHDKDHTHDWRDLQRIKNELVGPECEGIELYPAESRLMDQANQYHLYVLVDPTQGIPFGYPDKRSVWEYDTDSLEGGGRQRPFDDDCRPSDVQTITRNLQEEKRVAELNQMGGSYALMFAMHFENLGLGRILGKVFKKQSS